MTKSIYYVYILIDPRTNTPFYVGKGKNNRAVSHISRAKKWKQNGFKRPLRPNKKLYNKINSIMKDGKEIQIQYLKKNLPEKLALILEKKTISQIGLENLCNLTFGGEGETRTTETIIKIQKKRNKWLKSSSGQAFRKKLSKERTGSGNPMWGYKEDEKHKQERMKNMLAKPRWNKGLAGDPRCKGPTGKCPHNALMYRAINLETSEVFVGRIKDITKITKVPIVTIKRMLKKTYHSTSWSDKWKFIVIGPVKPASTFTNK